MQTQVHNDCCDKASDAIARLHLDDDVSGLGHKDIQDKGQIRVTQALGEISLLAPAIPVVPERMKHNIRSGEQNMTAGLVVPEPKAAFETAIVPTVPAVPEPKPHSKRRAAHASPAAAASR